MLPDKTQNVATDDAAGTDTTVSGSWPESGELRSWYICFSFGVIFLAAETMWQTAVAAARFTIIADQR
jgi:hypothetical protein